MLTLHTSLLNCTTFFAATITIITNQWGWRHSPCVCACWSAEGTFLSWPGREWEDLEKRGTAKQNSQRGLRSGRLESRSPFCDPGLVGACHPLCSMTGPSMWMSHGRSEVDPSSLLLKGINSVFPSLAIFFFFSLTLPYPLSPNIQLLVLLLIICSFNRLFSLPFFGISYSVNLAIDSCP